MSPTTIQVSWDAIPYTDDTGGYVLYYSDGASGYAMVDSTSDKSTNSLDYYWDGTGTCVAHSFYVRTWTDPHYSNSNTVTSEKSEVLFFDSADRKEWTGAQDSDWDNENNWDGFDIPGSGESVFIPSGPANWPQVGITAQGICSFTVDQGALVTILDGGGLSVVNRISLEGVLELQGEEVIIGE